MRILHRFKPRLQFIKDFFDLEKCSQSLVLYIILEWSSSKMVIFLNMVMFGQKDIYNLILMVVA